MPDFDTAISEAPTFTLTLPDKLLGQITFAAKGRALQGQCFFSLRIKGGVLNHRVDKDPHVIFDLEWLDRSGLVLLLDLVKTAGQPRSKGSTHSLFASCVESIST